MIDENRLPDDAQDSPPIPCDFKVGDKVVFTNDYGVEFQLFVRGFCPEPILNGRFIYVFTDCWWFPVKPESLRLVK